MTLAAPAHCPTAPYARMLGPTLATLAVLLVAPPARAAVPPLTDQPGDPARGASIVQDRARAACLLCHPAPLPTPHLHGTLAPSLGGVGDRLTPAEIRDRLVDPRRTNPDTIMPPYFATDGLHRVAAPLRDKPILSAQQIEDVVAYLATLRTP